MKKKSSTTLALSAALLALMLTASACSDNNNNGNAGASGTPAVTASASPNGVASPSGDPASGEPSGDPSSEPSGDAGAQETSGEYVGLGDGHSIEIKTADGPTVFQVSPEISDKVDPWEEGTKVKFTYTEETLDVNGEKVKQYTIQSIDKQ